MEERKETRGAKKGRPKPIGSGRKKTVNRDVNISFKVSKDEREAIYKALDEIGGKRTEALLKVLGIVKE